VAGGKFENPASLFATIAAVADGDRHPVLHQQVRHRRDVGEVREVGENQRLCRQQARRHQRQRRVLGAANRDRPG